MAYRILQGDVRERLQEMPEGHFHCCVTSPPYWSLRKYLKDGHPDAGKELGTEKLHDCLGWATGQKCGECYVCHLVQVMGEVHRVLREDGTLWLNLGDSYTSGGRSGHGTRVGYKQSTNRGMCGKNDPVRAEQPPNLKPKDLCGIPWRVALAVQADGWYWRSVVAWTKRSAMPESVRDRPTASWEPIFLFSKAARYFYDAEAVRQPDKGTDHSRSVLDGHPSLAPPGQPPHTGLRTPTGRDGRGANLRNVWPIPEVEPADDLPEWNLGPEPCMEAHFATFPTEIPRRAILAGTGAKGCCPECGAPWERVVEQTEPGRVDRPRHQYKPGRPDGMELRGGRLVPSVHQTLGWRPTCDHGFDPVPCQVLDPFAGAGTTLLVAEQLGRDSVGIELNPEYIEIAERRLQAGLPVTQRHTEHNEGFTLEFI